MVNFLHSFFAVAGTVNKRKAIAAIMVWVKDRCSCIADEWGYRRRSNLGKG
jgi:hypothetical protein